MKIDLTGQVAMVTGGGKGIGRHIALALAAAGSDVILIGRDAQALEEAAKTDEEIEPDDTDDMVFKDVEALKAHIFNLSDNHMEQVVMLVRGWMRNDETAKA